jgi:hypothetical protein
MVRSSVSVREEGCGAGFVDRHSEPCRASETTDVAAARSIEPAEDGRILPSAPVAEKCPPSQNAGNEIALHELWFALPRQEQQQFGGHFSRMLLRIVQSQVKSALNQLEPSS